VAPGVKASRPASEGTGRPLNATFKPSLVVLPIVDRRYLMGLSFGKPRSADMGASVDCPATSRMEGMPWSMVFATSMSCYHGTEADPGGFPRYGNAAVVIDWIVAYLSMTLIYLRGHEVAGC
jgi:hypothetical protein